MTFPRQKLYDVSHRRYFSSSLAGNLNNGDDGDFVSVMAKFTGSNRDVIPLSRGRLGIYFAVKNAVSTGRKRVLLSPFTIFDVVNMVLCAGGEPTFIDTGPSDVHLSVDGVEAELDQTVAAVIVTHYHTSNRQIARIAKIVSAAGAALIEDCAIGLGGSTSGRHNGLHGDFGVYSFGLFKFVATYFGGCMIVKDQEAAGAIRAEMSSWPKMTDRDLRPYLLKGLKFDALTNPIVFPYLTFPIFRKACELNIGWILRQAINDPKPVRRTSLPDAYKRRPSDFQQREWARQLPKVQEDRLKRLSNADSYWSILAKQNTMVTPPKPEHTTDCFLNFPVLVENRNEVLIEMMRRGFDISQYYYQNCANLSVFDDLLGESRNSESIADRVLVLPCYPQISEDYIFRLASNLVEIDRLYQARG